MTYRPSMLAALLIEVRAHPSEAAYPPTCRVNAAKPLRREGVSRYDTYGGLEV